MRFKVLSRSSIGGSGIDLILRHFCPQDRDESFSDKDTGDRFHHSTPTPTLRPLVSTVTRDAVTRGVTSHRPGVAAEKLEAVIQSVELFAMESKLLVGGKNIIDHTNEQQKMLEMKRQEIAEQTRTEREMQQQMLVQDEETLELRETFTSLQQEVEAKTKKLKKLYAKLQCIKAEIQDVNDEHVRSRQELEQTQNELTRELKFKYLIIENFIPPEEKNKIMNRLAFDPEEDQWKFQPLVPAESKSSQMKKRPASAVGYKRPISQYARVAIAMGPHSRYRAENIMFLELDMTPTNAVSLDRSSEAESNQSPSVDNSPTKDKSLRKSRS
ncbi:hypothetical protein INR49_026242, partial [Caranx melampygus]